LKNHFTLLLVLVLLNSTYSQSTGELLLNTSHNFIDIHSVGKDVMLFVCSVSVTYC